MIDIGQKARMAEFARLLEWIGKNPKKWNNVIHAFDEEYYMDDDDNIDIIRELSENQFYDVLFTLFQATRNPYVTNSVKTAAITNFSRRITPSILDEFVTMVTDSFMRLKN